jgi:hypothetical protein
MKQLLTILLLFLLAFEIHADCAMNGLSIYPSGKIINQNSIFILTGYGGSQEVILGLNKKYVTYLTCGTSKVKLNVLETHVGQFQLTQAVLKPVSELVAGLDYQIVIDSLPEYEGLGTYNRTTNRFGPVSFKVSNVRDLEKPKILSQARLLRKTYVAYGCGPEVYAIFSQPVTDKSGFVVKTKLKDLSTGLETIFYVLPYGNEIWVGHDMCSGGFDFGYANKFEVEFSFMDTSGNMTAWSGNKINFNRPKEK